MCVTATVHQSGSHLDWIPGRDGVAFSPQQHHEQSRAIHTSESLLVSYYRFLVQFQNLN